MFADRSGFPRTCIGAILALVTSTVAGAEPFQIVTGTGDLSTHVKAFDGTTEKFSFFSHTGFSGGVSVAVGDVNGDSAPDILSMAGPGGQGHVKAFSGTDLTLEKSFLAFPGFAGGVFVAAGDVNNDGKPDIVAGAGETSPGGHVKVFSNVGNDLIRSFLAYGDSFTGGVRVAAGDINGDGFADIITGTGPGAAGGHVKAFSGKDSSELRSFLAYGATFSGGVYVAAGDVNGDGFADIITGADAGASPHVKVFSGADNSEIRSFFAYDPAFTGGVRVAAGDINGDGFAEIVTGSGAGIPGQLKVFSGDSLALLENFLPYGDYRSGIFVAAVPEPAACSWLAIASFALCFRQRKLRRLDH